MSDNNNCLIQTKIKCNDNDTVKAIQNIIKELEHNSENLPFTPITKKDLNKTKKALDLYMKECNICAQEGANDHICMEQARLNLQRRIPIFSDNIYPWKNFDWNYANHVANNYDPKYTGATIKGSIKSMHQNAKAFIKLINGLVSDPIPNKKSKAGIKSKHSDYPPFSECDFRCKAAQKVKKQFKQKVPLKDNFLKKKLDGENSSSYFFKVGTCPRSDITNKKKCEKMGYTWTPNILDKVLKKISKTPASTLESGVCNQPRYAYLNNTPKTFTNGSKAKGLVPSIANDIMALTPDKILAVATGSSFSDSFVMQQCPGNEGFVNYGKKFSKKNLNFKEIMNEFNKADISEDGVVNKDEFNKWMHKTNVIKLVKKKKNKNKNLKAKWNKKYKKLNKKNKILKKKIKIKKKKKENYLKKRLKIFEKAAKKAKISFSLGGKKMEIPSVSKIISILLILFIIIMIILLIFNTETKEKANDVCSFVSDNFDYFCQQLTNIVITAFNYLFYTYYGIIFWLVVFLLSYIVYGINPLLYIYIKLLLIISKIPIISAAFGTPSI